MSTDATGYLAYPVVRRAYGAYLAVRKLPEHATQYRPPVPKSLSTNGNTLFDSTAPTWPHRLKGIMLLPSHGRPCGNERWHVKG